jgi:DNA mismatch endonuclease (patch repair protein)
MSHWPGNAKTQRTSFGGLSRSELMSRVHSKGNETTETRLARLLRKSHLKGWRRHSPLLGKPDFVWPAERVVVFVDGCFWHGHQCGHRNLTPRTNPAAWREKLMRNRARDRRVTRHLRRRGWRVVRIWECQLARRPRTCIRRIAQALGRVDDTGR